jgi:hypothetical protein
MLCPPFIQEVLVFKEGYGHWWRSLAYALPHSLEENSDQQLWIGIAAKSNGLHGRHAL